uniref:Isopenicillin N synthase-like Fe(2+) 2OG dioxygenase domain-containing protein n=1 Tax=Haptolina ericina TaxID=156174 RepID=A0A7S3B0A2_9EUKA
MPYAASFASIFNFDQGFLNPHRDRGLLTLIYGRPCGSPHIRPTDTVRLWGCEPGGAWFALDACVPDDDHLLVLAGEQLERLSDSVCPAITHACRVDPQAERISMLHHGPHPGARSRGNRQSMAFVLQEQV